MVCAISNSLSECWSIRMLRILLLIDVVAMTTKYECLETQLWVSKGVGRG